MAQRTVIGQDRIVYSTDRDLFEQDYDTQDWDQRFREIEKSDWEGRTANFTFWLLVNTVETREATIYYDCNRYLMTTNVYAFVIWIFVFLIGGIPLLKLKRVLCFHLDLFLPQPGSEHLTNTGIQKQLIWYCGCPMNRRARVAGAPRSHI